MGTLAALGVVGSVLGAAGASTLPAEAAVGDPITGTIWQDYDSDGMYDTFEASGLLEGIEVYAYDAAGNVAGPAITDASGNYSLPVTSDAGPWRVEANVPDTPEWEEWRDSVVGRAAGQSNGTTVQFIDTVPASDIDFSFQVPGAFMENNPYVFLPAFRFGASDGAQGGLFGGAAHEYEAVSPNTNTAVPLSMQVPFNQIGTTYGTAWQRAEEPGGTGTVFASAYVRRHTGMGPGGVDAIYRITPDGGTPSSPTASGDVFVNLSDYGIDVGSDSDPGAVAGDPNGLRPALTLENPVYDWGTDAQAWDRVGREGLGAMEISNDQESLFVVNLHNRSLVEIGISRDGTQVTDVTEHELDQYFPDSSDLRPHGISANPLTNEMYLTVTNTAESTQNRADLHAYVYSFDPADPTNLTQVLDFPLGYTRGLFANQFSADYQPWNTNPAFWLQFGQPAALPYSFVMNTAVPIVADARYLHGDLIVGIRDLGGDLFGGQSALAPGDPRLVAERSLGGELLKAGSNGDGTWSIEQNGVVNGVQGAFANGVTLNGPNGQQGKFFMDTWVNGVEHLGATLVIQSRDDGVMETGIHVAEGSYQVGTRRFEQNTGSVVDPRGAAVMTDMNIGINATMKGNGVGELTAMASAAPIEIGNYVWYDIDNDGVQDPDEPVVEGATVNLYEVDENGNRTLVSTTTTDANGEYYFSSNDQNYQLKTHTDYVVGVDNPADYEPGGPLENWYPTVPDTGDPNSVDPDRNDSDGIVETTPDGDFPYAAITTGGPGENDHTIDFGYSNIDYEFDKRTVSGPTESPDDDGTWTVVYELVAENTGMIPGAYLLTDDLTGYGDGVEVVDTQVVSGPPEAAGLLNPNWDGTTDLNVVTGEVPIAPQSTVENGTEHVYTLEVTVRLTTDPDTGEVTALPENLACTDGQQAGDATTGLFNHATMSPDNHEDLTDDECGDLPIVTLDKTVVTEPHVVDRENQPGVWEITYGLTVTNESEVPTDYDLEDALRFGTGIEIVDGSVVAANTVPGSITTRPEYDGVTDLLIVEDEPIGALESHEYTVTVQFTVNLPNPPAQPDPSDCTLAGGEGEDGTGLYNDANSSFNSYPDTDTECREVGQPTHTKSLISAEPIGNGQWQIVYGIDVVNKGVQATWYDLEDELHFSDQVTIVTADVTASPAEATLFDPPWNGQDQLVIAEQVPILGTDDDGYAPQHYELTVIAEAPLQFEIGEGGADPTACPAEGEDPTADTAFNNTSTLTDEAGLEEDDQACAPLPSIDIEKTISSGPTANGDGTWTITYDLVASNTGQGDGDYDISDRLRYGEGIVVEDAQVITTPDGVTALDTWTGQGPDGDPVNVIATDVPLSAGGVHTYQVQVVFSLDEDTLTEESMACPEPDSGENGGLANSTGIEHNDLTDDDEACLSLGEPDLDKELVSAEPVGDGQWQVVYTLTVNNLLPGETTYDLEDELLFGDTVEVDYAEVTDYPDGVDVNEDWDGLEDTLIAEDVPLAGMNDEAYAPHVYTITVVADVPPAFEVDEDGNTQAACQGEPGDNWENGGLNNGATLTTEGGDEITDTDCADLPSIHLDKTIASGPTSTGTNAYTITYELEVTNDGAAAGDYVLSDQLNYGAGIDIVDVTAANTEPGDVPVLDTFTGQGAEPDAPENAITGEVSIDVDTTHTYEVTVAVTVDPATATAESVQCPEDPGEGDTGGLLNLGLVDHNDHELEADACAPVDPPTPPDTPGGDDGDDTGNDGGNDNGGNDGGNGGGNDGGDDDLADTGSTSTPLLLAGALLLLAGATALIATRRHTRTGGLTS
ncbi:SdrD B-like domain-containing protein [Jiangella rhizosphaerae]|uniref:SdrD B-like domain-containing protein n=1 Tax=Jiangella rhizosphaerae TaxID=2293569 RepID=UPI001314B17B|nr:SdrD B-like domain-containing protein [Jiangella rhizosphaerae]